MSGLKDFAKGGWHPKGKDGGKESWRGDFKGINQVAGWMGKGKDPHAREAREHQSTPLSALKDPASFGPPPTRQVGSGQSEAGGLGAAIPRSHIHAREERKQAEEEEADKPMSPPVPYRADTTGLSTANLPKPPVRRADDGSPGPASPGQKRKPTLPPRLPPRQNSRPDAYTPAPPPSYDESVQLPASSGSLNQGALDRLENAGVSVPGFDIGRHASPPVPPRAGQAPASSGKPSLPSSHAGQLSELQARFSKMSSTSASPVQTSEGTSWAQKQAALKTANALRSDPSSVSIADAKTAAMTANNFRERHGEQVATGLKTASGLNQKYGVLDKVNKNFPSSRNAAASPTSASEWQQSSPSTASAAVNKKPPPPPPKKKELTASSGEPPPIPFSSKPQT